MKKWNFIIILLLFISISYSDTFTHNETGDSFNGFTTSKTLRGLTRVYNAGKQSFEPINLSKYTVVMNEKGRRNTIVVIPITEAEVLLSKYVCEQIAEAILNEADKGPKIILLEIDCPGGRGEFMRIITEAISKTNHCPIVAYINNAKYGGAFSAAAGITLACDKVYISPDSAVGSIAPVVGTQIAPTDILAHKDLFSHKKLGLFKTYIAALAEKNNRPRAISEALFDRSVEVVEVSDPQGEKAFVDRKNRKPADTVVKTWSKSNVVASASKDGQESGEIQQIEFELSMTPEETLYCGLADKIVSSLNEIASDMGSADARMYYAIKIEKPIRRFIANRLTMDRLLASIEYLEQRAAELNQLLKDAERINQENMSTREYRRDNLSQSRFVRNQYTEPDTESRINRETGVRNQIESEIVIESEQIDTFVLLDELEFVLADLLADYRRAITVARQFPGALPEDISLIQLEQQSNNTDVWYRNVLQQ